MKLKNKFHLFIDGHIGHRGDWSTQGHVGVACQNIFLCLADVDFIYDVAFT